jgi:hypothetical protein
MDNDRRVIEHVQDDWSMRMEHHADPEHVRISLSGTPTNETVETYYRDIITLMDAIVGTGKPFVPVIFDTTSVERGRVTLPVIWKSPGQVPRRVTKIIVVLETDRNSLIDTFIRTLARAMPSMEAAPTIEEALRQLRAPRSPSQSTQAFPE